MKVLWEEIESAEATKNRYVTQLQKWMQKLPNGLWNYVQWDEFLDTLDSSADVAYLEKVRDASKEIYLDPQTGLMWARNGNIAGKRMTWDEAMSWVKKLNYAGYSDWRLPTIEELEAFVKLGGEIPSEWFNANGFSNA